MAGLRAPADPARGLRHNSVRESLKTSVHRRAQCSDVTPTSQCSSGRRQARAAKRARGRRGLGTALRCPLAHRRGRRPGSCGGGRRRRKGGSVGHAGGSVGHAGGRTSATLLPLRRIESSRVILLPSEVISLRRRDMRCVLGALAGRQAGARGGSRAVGGSGMHALFCHVLEHHVDVVVEA